MSVLSLPGLTGQSMVPDSIRLLDSRLRGNDREKDCDTAS